MKYPVFKIDRRPVVLSKADKEMFRCYKRIARESIISDTSLNLIKLPKKDIALLSQNIAISLVWELRISKRQPSDYAMTELAKESEK